MRVLHVIRQFTPSVGGLESYLTSLLREQTKLGYDCEVLTLNKIFRMPAKTLPAHEVINGITVHRVPFIGRKRAFLPLFNPNRFKDFDIIHVHNTDPMFDLAALTRWMHKRPIVCTTHGGFFHTDYVARLKELYFGTVTKWNSRAYDWFFACSENDERRFQAISDRVVLLFNAIDPLGDFLSEGRDLLYFGRLAENKRVGDLFAAHAQLLRLGNECRLHIVGPEYEVTIAELQAQADRLGTAEWVTIHGYLEDEDLKQLASRCGFFASASQFEGFGMSMIEAMSVGLLPLVQANDSFSDLHRRAGVGLVVDYGEPERAAAQIGRYMNDHDPHDRQRARAFAKQFDWARLAQRLDGYYRQIGKDPNPATSADIRPNFAEG